ncbi:MAG TPA: DUF4142 domain-containing protein [Longimicrobiaceae bacterium]|nr:DUF4142 domain-containing protein [Longimicrobiaceae bacterium]
MPRVFVRSLLVTVAAASAAGILTMTGTAQSRGPATTALSDAEIAHIAVTANDIDVEIAKIAEARATDSGVRRFAERMMRDHSGVIARARAVANRLAIAPADNAVSRSLRHDASGAKARLSKLRGRAFDRAYMDREIAYHQAVLDALDDTLIPGARNRELRDLLEHVHPVMVVHLEQAKQIRASLGGMR